MEKLNVEDQAQGKPVDIHLFEQVQAQKFKVFMDRRAQYGNHLENARRFPKEYQCGLYLKCARLIRDIESGNIKKDTLLDLTNYCDIELSHMEAECAERERE